MFTSGTNPPSGLKLSCMALTAPQEVSVVIVAHRAELATPNRVSLPSKLPADWLTGRPRRAGLGIDSAQ